MYKFRSVTDRVIAYRDKIRDRVIQTDSEQAVIITESFKRNQSVHPMIKIPTCTYDVCANMTIEIYDDDMFAMNRTRYFCGSPVSPQWTPSWIVPMVEQGVWTMREDGLYHNPDNEDLKLTISQEDFEALRDIQDYWAAGNMLGASAEAWQPDGYTELAELGCSSYAPGLPLISFPLGHLTVGLNKIVTVGYGAIRKQAQDWIDEHRGNLMGADIDKYMFYKSAVIACDAAITLVSRYAAAAKEKYEACTDEKRKAEFKRMYEGLEWIAENPARTFWEALQAIMLYKHLLAIDANYPCISFGRLDQYTWPYLEKDLEAGTITLDEAQELMDFYLLKANTSYAAMQPWVATITGIGNTYQHTTIAGTDPVTGKDATNPVTYMTLETLTRLHLHDPTISIRITQDTPDELWECALETSRVIGGLPLFQNDDIIIPGLMRECGFSLEDARDYAVIGCQEITGNGNDYPAPNGTHPPHAGVHFGVILTMALNNGINPFNGVQASFKPGYLYEMQSIEEVKQAVEDMSRYIIRLFHSIQNYSEFISIYSSPHAAMSISIEGCMENGKDCTAGGAKYNSAGTTATGLATLADSISTIKYMCFDKKLCTTRELYDAFMANWEGYETLRQQILAEVPHFGNNDPYVDEEMTWICDLYYKLTRECYSNRTDKFKCGLYGASDHVAQGYHTWATPDGRLTGTPIADAVSPAQGRDLFGPTAVFISGTCYDASKYMDGTALNIRIHPKSLEREDGIRKLRDMTRTFFNSGGMEVQYNVVSTETLRAAQEEPEKYKDLIVRIAGYSAYFVELNRDCQNDVISRTENAI